MARDITAALKTEFTAQNVRPIILTKFEFDSGDLLLWDGIRPFTYLAQEYIGAGNFLTVEAVKETTGLNAHALIFTLSGMPSSLISYALNEDYQNRDCSLIIGALDSAGAIVLNPYVAWQGRMDVMTIEEAGETSTISIRAEHVLKRGDNPTPRRWTHEDQQIDHLGDLGFDQVANLQDLTIEWGS